MGFVLKLKDKLQTFVSKVVGSELLHAADDPAVRIDILILYGTGKR